MLSRTTLARAFALPWEQQHNAFLRPSFRACLHQATNASSSSSSSSSTSHPENPLSATPRGQSSPPTTQTPPKPSQDQASPLRLTKSLLEKLPYLTSQKPHYITAHLYARPYLLTAGDHLRLPFLMRGVKPGDILRFNRASVLGSRDFTLKGAPYIDERLFECRVRVMGVDAEPMRVKEKTKRRQRHVRKVKSKHKYTLLRVMDVKVKTAEELLEQGAVVVEGEDVPKMEANT